MIAFLGVQLFAKHHWRHELTQMLHSRKSYKTFFRDLEIDAHIEGERIAKYTTFGMYLNTHHNAKHCYLARCALRRRDNPEFEPGRHAVIRVIPTQCEDSRTDFLMRDSEALTVEGRYSIWQGTQRIKEYYSDPSLKYDFEESEKGFIQFLLKSKHKHGKQTQAGRAKNTSRANKHTHGKQTQPDTDRASKHKQSKQTQEGLANSSRASKTQAWRADTGRASKHNHCNQTQAWQAWQAWQA